MNRTRGGVVHTHTHTHTNITIKRRFTLVNLLKEGAADERL